jgi:hypothetical protein
MALINLTLMHISLVVVPLFRLTSRLVGNGVFELSIGYDKTNGDRETIYYPEELIKLYPELYPEPSHTFIEAESLDLLHIDLATRYYITPDLFAKLVPVLYLAGGNEDVVAGGIGGTAAVGYQLMMDNRNKLEFVFNTDLINSRNGRGNGVIPIAGQRLHIR